MWVRSNRENFCFMFKMLPFEHCRMSWSALVKNLLFLDAASCISAIFRLKEALCLSTISRSVKLPKFVDAAISIALT